MGSLHYWFYSALIVLTLAGFSSARAEAPYSPDQVIVRFDGPTNLKEAKAALDGEKFLVTQVLVPSIDIFLVKLVGIEVPDALDLLKSDPRLRWVQADHDLSQRLTPNDPQFGSQWNMNQASDADIDAPEAWNLTTGGTDVSGDPIVVAIVDAGCLLTHQDLSANIWVNTGEIPGNGVDDDGNGYVDDVNGWDAYSNDGSIPTDNHGTHVSGIAGARGNNSTHVCGVNWNVKLMEVAASSGQTSIISIGYSYVLTQKTRWLQSGGVLGANVVSTNSSFGVDLANCSSGSYPIWNDLYNAMGTIGILSACATANLNINVDTQGDVPTGCSSPYIIAVTNTTSTDQRNSSAAYGAINVDLGAPGTNILSTTSNNSTGLLSGTSMATPHVAGAIGFLHAAANGAFNAYYHTYPDSAALALKELILDNVDALPALQGITVSGGRLNLNQAAVAINNFIAPDTNAPNLTVISQVIDDSSTGNANGVLDAGESANLIVAVLNSAADAINVTGVLSESDAYLVIDDNFGSFGSIERNQTGYNTVDEFIVSASISTPLEHDVQFSIQLNSDGGYVFNRTFSLTIGQKAVYWSDSVENGEGDWTHSNVTDDFNDQWHISTEMFSSPSHAWKCGDSQSGAYAALLDAGLVTPNIALTAMSELRFSHWMESELSGAFPDSAYDGGIVEISVNNGPFLQLTPQGGYSKTFRWTAGGGNPASGPMPGLACFAGTIPWEEKRVDLAEYAGENVRFRFRFGSDNGTNREGWYIDNIVVRGMAPASPAPDAVDDLVILPQVSDIGLHWNASSGANYYVVYRGSIPEFEPTPADSIGWTSDTMFVDPGITSAQANSFYAIKAVR